MLTFQKQFPRHVSNVFESVNRVVVRAWATWAQAHTEIRQHGPGPRPERGPYLRKLLINDKKQKMGHFLGPEFNSTLQTLYLIWLFQIPYLAWGITHASLSYVVCDHNSPNWLFEDLTDETEIRLASWYGQMWTVIQETVSTHITQVLC